MRWDEVIGLAGLIVEIAAEKYAKVADKEVLLDMGWDELITLLSRTEDGIPDDFLKTVRPAIWKVITIMSIDKFLWKAAWTLDKRPDRADTLHQEGLVAAVEAYRSWDQRKASFLSYAGSGIVQKMRSSRYEGRLIALPRWFEQKVMKPVRRSDDPMNDTAVRHAVRKSRKKELTNVEIDAEILLALACIEKTVELEPATVAELEDNEFAEVEDVAASVLTEQEYDLTITRRHQTLVEAGKSHGLAGQRVSEIRCSAAAKLRREMS